MVKKQKKHEKGRVVIITDEDNKALKQHFLDLENSGSKKSRQEIVDDLFRLGLYENIKSLRNHKPVYND